MAASILEILKEAVAEQTSDILITAGSPVTFHIHGTLVPYDPDWILSGTETQELIYQFMTMEQRKTFENERDLDMAYHIPGLARFRVNVFQQRGTLACVLRLVPLRVPHYTEIGITEKVILEMANMPNGLVLMTGPTGAGKSTSIASFIEYLNTEASAPRHVITIEDPIEFLFTPKVCVIDQREIGYDVKSYTRGLRSALRQMPHIIFVGEMRDRETIEVALTAAETGNIVISTLSTQSAAKTINRIIDIFPVEHQPEIRTRLALTLKVVMAQLLMKRIDVPGRVAARELMFVNSAISNLIREGKIHQVNNAIATHSREGMVLMDDSILDLASRGIISYASAVIRMTDAEKLARLQAR
jgi:twitching motility protein PilT